MSIKCLFIMHSYGGGAEKVCLTLVKHLPQKNFKISVGCPNFVEKLRHALPRQRHYLAPARRNFGEKLKNFLALWQEARISDCVIGTLELQSIFWAAAFAPQKAIGWLHKDLVGYGTQKSFFSRHIYMSIFAWCTRRCQCIVCVSKGVQKSAQSLFPTLQHKFILVYNPLELQEISANAHKALPESLYYTFRHKVILSVGRLVPQKAYHTLIRAHALLRKKGYLHHLCILGEGPERIRLEALCRELQVESSVNLPGFMEPFSAMYHSSVFALSSEFEGMPLVLFEAMSLGVPIVSTDCPSGPREVLQNGAYGTLVPMNNHTALAEALLPYVHTDDPAQSAEQKLRGYHRAAEFDVSHCLHAWEDIIKNVALGTYSY